jgi:hypothetical protein
MNCRGHGTSLSSLKGLERINVAYPRLKAWAMIFRPASRDSTPVIGAVICAGPIMRSFVRATDELHFDHDLPWSKGGTSLTEENVQLLCARHNLQKHDRIL